MTMNSIAVTALYFVWLLTRIRDWYFVSRMYQDVPSNEFLLQNNNTPVKERIQLEATGAAATGKCHSPVNRNTWSSTSENEETIPAAGRAPSDTYCILLGS